jgi:hypothetical protein
MPARLRDIARVCVNYFGLEVEKPSSGSHWKLKSAKCTYPVPAHNAEKTEIADKYIKGLCRAHEIDYAEMKRRLEE